MNPQFPGRCFWLLVLALTLVACGVVMGWVTVPLVALLVWSMDRLRADWGRAAASEAQLAQTLRSTTDAEATRLATSRRLEIQNAALAGQARNPVLRGDDLPAAFRAITEVAARTLDAARVSIWLYNEDRSVIRSADLYEHPAGVHSDGVELRIGQYPRYFAALAENRAIAAHDARSDPRTSEFRADYLEPMGITSMLDALIRSGDEIVGVVCHEHIGPAREWTLDEQSFAGSMADLAALSLEVHQRHEAERALQAAHAELEARVARRTAALSAANQRLETQAGELAEAKDRAEAADRIKSAFLATMSHELRTPLNSIIGFTGIMTQGLAGPLNPEQTKQLGMVQASARHLLALINDVLDISKIEAGELKVGRAPFDLRASIANVTNIVRPLAEKKGLALRVEVAPEVGGLVSDQRRVEQVLLNLLSNAVKFTERGAVTLTADSPAAGVRVRVADTGIGIKPEDLAKLFRPFQQVDTGLSRNHEGTGLGLAICRKLATMLGGTMEAASEWERGSVFTFTLPAETLGALGSSTRS